MRGRLKKFFAQGAIWFVLLIVSALAETFAHPYLKPVFRSLGLAAPVETVLFFIPVLVIGALMIWRFKLYR